MKPACAAATSAPVYFAGPVDRCDLCQRPLADEPGFGDVELPDAGGAWGVLCLPCCAAAQVVWGWGSGQEYGREPGGRWLLLRGGHL